MNIAIIGFGIEGRAAYDYWHKDNEITICDQNEELQLPSDVKAQLGNDYLQGLDEFDLIIRSPFVRPDAIIAANSVAVIPKITSSTNEFLRVCPSRNIIGVTGTKGKGTTSSLITAILRAAGYTVHLGGNIGVAAIDLLKADINPDDYVVLELSSYQLIDLRQSPHIAACLIVMPEHLDWHTDEQEYYAAKQELFRQQTADDIAIYYALNETSRMIASAGQAHKIPYMHSPGAYVDGDLIKIDDRVMCKTSELQLIGKHNWQNACAAVTVAWQITQDVAAIKSALTTFKGLPFRIEFRKEVNGIRYFNDSFATGPGSCIAAMEAIEGPKVMILGGHDRGLGLTELVAAIDAQGQNYRNAVIIGDSRNRLAEALRAHNISNFTVSDAQTMPEIVAQATAMAQPGDAVVLSPAFASFGLFKNFEDRGRQFNEAVEAL
jgi:UDP-N-acetylmuramoylalanine--D-glutamate ligase